MEITKDLIDKLPPKMELSYDIVEHNKVQPFNICMAIPDGKRCLLWFTFHNKDKVATVCHMDRLNKVTHITVVSTVFHGDLSLGTIFGGTLFHYNDTKFFAIDDVHYYKGKNVERTDTRSKLALFAYIMKHEIQQTVFTKYDMVVGLPVMHTNRRALMEKFDTLPYKVTGIKYMTNNQHQAAFVSPYTQVSYSNTFPNAPTAIFKVTADNQNDIYNLYCYGNGTPDHFYAVAFVPDYTTSVFLNKQFRNIKENINLDYLEESDDDDDFENTSDDKFVIPGKEIRMMCLYNYRFKRWVPTKIVKTGSLCNLRDLEEMERNNFGQIGHTVDYGMSGRGGGRGGRGGGRGGRGGGKGGQSRNYNHYIDNRASSTHDYHNDTPTHNHNQQQYPNHTPTHNHNHNHNHNQQQYPNHTPNHNHNHNHYQQQYPNHTPNHNHYHNHNQQQYPNHTPNHNHNQQQYPNHTPTHNHNHNHNQQHYPNHTPNHNHNQQHYPNHTPTHTHPRPNHPPPVKLTPRRVSTPELL